MRTRLLQQPPQLGAPRPGRAAGGLAALPLRSLALALAAAGTLLAGPTARAAFIEATLGSAGPGSWAILSTGNPSTTDFALNGPGTTLGNVGVGATGKLSLDSSNGNPATAIIGNVFLATGSSLTHPQQVQGNIVMGADTMLGQAAADARAATGTFAGLSATNPTTSIGNSTGTVTGTAGVNVLNITALNLNHAGLTLNAPKGGQFVINDSGQFTLNSGVINLAGGLTPSDVVFNLTGIGPDVHTSGGLHDESVVNGILLAEGRKLDFSPGLVNGEVISDSDHIHFVSGAEVHQATPPPGPSLPGAATAPEPASVVLLVLGLPALAAYACRARRRPVQAASRPETSWSKDRVEWPGPRVDLPGVGG